ncbi:zinc finger protein 26-like [Culicoides brevitarsis]|uniref:zinc finger protein 26-like n=1 Tax=Culicoides brevitarsis TaxID=469753 RepID=UPI00307C378B
MKVKLTEEDLFFDFIEADFDKNLEIFDPEVDIIKIAENFSLQSRFQCNFCHKSYATKRSFLRHIDFHEGRFTCEICEQKCTSKSTLEIHINRCHKSTIAHEDDKENVTKTHIWCSLCSRYVRKSFLQFHLKRSHINESRNENLNTLLCLLEATNAKREVFQCEICDKSYENYSSLKTHRNIHSDKFLCQICGKPNASLTALRRHFKSHKVDCERDNLENDTNYEFCDKCEKYVNKFRMRHHQRTHLSRHMNTHLQLCKFKCIECGKAYKQNSSLQHHITKHRHNC